MVLIINRQLFGKKEKSLHCSSHMACRQCKWNGRKVRRNNGRASLGCTREGGRWEGRRWVVGGERWKRGSGRREGGGRREGRVINSQTERPLKKKKGWTQEGEKLWIIIYQRKICCTEQSIRGKIKPKGVNQKITAIQHLLLLESLGHTVHWQQNIKQKKLMEK